MDEAATCPDSNGRVTIGSGSIRTGARLAMLKSIDAYGDGCPTCPSGGKPVKPVINWVNFFDPKK